MKKLASFGFSATAAASLTAEEVRAAASDEVPIVTGYRRKDPNDPFSERVRHVEYVPAVWYDALQRARHAKELAVQRYLSRPGIVGIGINPGEGTAKSSVLIFTDTDPADVDGPGREMTPPGAAEPVPVTYERVGDISQGYCDESQLDWWDATEEPAYGGYYIYVPDVGTSGTLACPVYANDSVYGLSANHVLKEEWNDIYDNHGNYIGTATAEQHCHEDWGLFDVPSAIDMRSDVRYNYYSGITGYFTKDGCSELVRNNAYCQKVGHTTCWSTFEITGVDITTEGGGQCWRERHQNYYEADDGDFEDGDSGSLVFHESPIDADFCWAVGLGNYHGKGWYSDHDVWGVGAWRIRDRGYFF